MIMEESTGAVRTPVENLLLEEMALDDLFDIIQESDEGSALDDIEDLDDIDDDYDEEELFEDYDHDDDEELF